MLRHVRSEIFSVASKITFNFTLNFLFLSVFCLFCIFHIIVVSCERHFYSFNYWSAKTKNNRPLDLPPKYVPCICWSSYPCALISFLIYLIEIVIKFNSPRLDQSSFYRLAVVLSHVSGCCADFHEGRTWPERNYRHWPPFTDTLQYQVLRIGLCWLR